MDREMNQRHLELAEQHIVQGTAHVERQRELVAKLVADGHKGEIVEEAKELLKQFESMLALHIEDRDRIKKELAQ